MPFIPFRIVYKPLVTTSLQLLPGLPCFFLICRTFSPEHITDEQAKEVFDEVTELQEQHSHEFSGERS